MKNLAVLGRSKRRLFALLLLAFLVAQAVLDKEGAMLSGNLSWAVLIAALVWACLVAFSYDYLLQPCQRAQNYNFGGNLADLIHSDSFFFTAPYIDPFLRLIEKNRVRIALPGDNRFKKLPKVEGCYLESGKRFFAVLPIRFGRGSRAGPPADYAIAPIFRSPG